MPFPHSRDFVFTIRGSDLAGSATCYTTTAEIFHSGATVTFYWKSDNGNETSLGVDNTYGNPIYGSVDSTGGAEQFRAVMGGYTFSTTTCASLTINGSESWFGPLVQV